MNLDRDAAFATLAQRLRLDRPLAFLDLETTGVSADNDRIIEIAVVKVEPKGDVRRFASLVDPEMEIPASATAVHGITDADVRGAPCFATLAGELTAFLDGCDLGGFNVGKFDVRMLFAELARAGVQHQLASARVVDAMTIFHRNEKRDLSSAVRFYSGRDHVGHRALADVEASIDVLLGQLDRYAELPKDVAGLHDYCCNRVTDALTSNGGVVWRDGAARFTFGKHAGKSLQVLVSDEPGYLRWLLDKNFPDDVKRLVADAIAGKLPQPPA